MKKISFDFDNTIAMSYMTYEGDKAVPVFQSYNDKIIKKIKKLIKNGDDIYIVTARTKDSKTSNQTDILPKIRRNPKKFE